MFVHAVNRLQARAVGGGRGEHYFQRGRARAEIRVTLMESAAPISHANFTTDNRVRYDSHRTPELNERLTNFSASTYHRKYTTQLSPNSPAKFPEAWILHTSRATRVTITHTNGATPRSGSGGYPNCWRCAGAALTSRAGYSHGGATRTAPPPSRCRRAPARLFSVPKIQDSDPPFRLRRMSRPLPVTLPHANLIIEDGRGGSY